MEPGPSTQQVARKYDGKIADYRQRTTNKGRSELQRNSVELALFLYFVYKVCLFSKVQNALAYALANEIIDEEEFVLLFDAYKSVNSSYPYWEYDGFCLDSFDSSECLTEFRVSKEDLPRLAEVLRVPRQTRGEVISVCKEQRECLIRKFCFSAKFKLSNVAFKISKQKLAVNCSLFLVQKHFKLIKMWFLVYVLESRNTSVKILTLNVLISYIFHESVLTLITLRKNCRLRTVVSLRRWDAKARVSSQS